MALSIIWFNDTSQLMKKDKGYKDTLYRLATIKQTHTKVNEIT